MLEKMKKIPYGVIPIIFVMAVIPLVVRYIEFEAHLNMMSWYVSSDKSGDMFTYYKGEFLTATAAVMIGVILLGFLVMKKYYWNKALIPLIVYAVLIILSTIFSQFQYYSLNGMDNHFETVYVLLTYCLLVVYCYWFVNSQTALKLLLGGWLAGITLMGVVGLFQVTGHDLNLTKLGRFLVLSKSLRESGSEITLSFPKGTVYLTLYNPNYVGFYAALTIPILIAVFLATKKWLLKGYCFILSIVMFICLLGSGARNGIVALGVALVVMILFFRQKLKKYWIHLAVGILAVAAIFIGYNAMNDNVLFNRLKEGFKIEANEVAKLENIETNDDNVTIVYDGNRLEITMDILSEDSMEVSLKDQDGNEVQKERMETETMSYNITDERFPFQVTIGVVQNHYGFVVDIDGKSWCFSNQTGYSGYYFYSPYGKFTKIETADTMVFTNYDKLASGRGYLWARTIPLLKKYFLIGSGPDTFTVVFPQKDYVAASAMGYDKMTVTKPHNLYLQIGVQTGAVSMIAFIVLNAMYLWECFRLYWKKGSAHFLEYMGIAFMIAILGYLISGIINDSTITVAPIYWCALGIGLAVNRMVKMERNSK